MDEEAFTSFCLLFQAATVNQAYTINHYRLTTDYDEHPGISVLPYFRTSAQYVSSDLTPARMIKETLMQKEVNEKTDR